MRLHYLQHVPFEGLGSISTWAQKQGHSVSCTRLFESNSLSSHTCSLDFPSLSSFDLLIIMGGPMSVNDHTSYPWLIKEKSFIQNCLTHNKTILGICLGAQLIASALGASVYSNSQPEIGWFPLSSTSPPSSSSTLSFSLPPKLFEIPVFHWHGETFDLPTNAIHLAQSEACFHQAFLYRNNVLGLQFHLETTQETAQQLIQNCSNELVDAPFIQSPDIMLQNENFFSDINEVMEQILFSLETASTE